MSKHNSHNDKTSLIKLITKVRGLIKVNKANYKIKRASQAKDNHKAFYSYVWNLKGNTQQCAELVVNSTIFTAQSHIANASEILTSITHPTISREQVIAVLTKAKKPPSMGLNSIPGCLLNSLKHDLPGPLESLFNYSLKTDYLLRECRTAMVIPLPKGGLSSNPRKYRPISLATLVCKAIERFIMEMISKDINNLQSLDSSQFNFVKERPCLLNMVDFFEKVTRTMEERKQCIPPT